MIFHAKVGKGGIILVDKANLMLYVITKHILLGKHGIIYIFLKDGKPTFNRVRQVLSMIKLTAIHVIRQNLKFFNINHLHVIYAVIILIKSYIGLLLIINEQKAIARR